jgi:4-hydroxy-3-methylbut-2-enyl diphosphate reductase
MRGAQRRSSSLTEGAFRETTESMTQSDTKPPLSIVLAAPRGFCAGVDRAIQIVEQSLSKWGAPVYVRHEIVHNRHVVESLEAKGAVFVEELDECPLDRPVVFSAHGVPKSVPAEAQKRQMIYVDATCPLVSKVHIEAERHHRQGHHILLIGHEGHPEVIGTMGQLPEGSISLIEDEAQAEAFTPPSAMPLAFVTQTTLSVDDTARVVEVLRRRFPEIAAPKKEDICYATTNRQEAVKAIAPKVDGMVVIGAPNSSNSKRLVEVGKTAGCSNSKLIQRGAEITADWLDGVTRLGITAGASAPEVLVEEVIAACSALREVTIEEVELTREDVHFKLPRELVVA